MKNLDGITITIPGFENYNGRKDIKKCSWLRLENAISTSEAMFGLDAAERYVFVEILCRASDKQNKHVRINVEYLAQRSAATPAQVRSALTKLLANGTFELHEQTRTNPNGSVRTEEDNPPARSDSEGSSSGLALTDGRDERDGPDETNERDEVNFAPESPITLAEPLRPFDPESKLELAFLQRSVPLETQQALLDAYPDPKWVAQQAFKALAWEATTERVPPMVWWSVPFLFDQITKDFAREDRAEPTFHEALNADVLFLDDLGTQQGKPWETERLFQLLDRRLNSELPTFVTTNLATGEVKNLLHERLASRLLGLCIPITLKSRDRRHDVLSDRLRELQRRG